MRPAGSSKRRSAESGSNGSDLPRRDVESIRAQVGDDPSERLVFTDSVLMNIGLGDPELRLAPIIEGGEGSRNGAQLHSGDHAARATTTSSARSATEPEATKRARTPSRPGPAAVPGTTPIERESIEEAERRPFDDDPNQAPHRRHNRFAPGAETVRWNRAAAPALDDPLLRPGRHPDNKNAGVGIRRHSRAGWQATAKLFRTSSLRRVQPGSPPETRRGQMKGWARGFTTRHKNTRGHTKKKKGIDSRINWHH